MRLVPTAMTEAWQAEDKTGPRRPVVRATISRFRLKRFPYDTAWAANGSDMLWESTKLREGTFTSALFGGDMDVREIKNIQSCNWNRSTEQDVATCTLTLLNSELTPIGNNERIEFAQDFDMPGFFTYGRDGEQAIERWDFEETGWEDLFIPDRLVKTYEGYGSDDTKPPGLDDNLIPSGTWLIDTVAYSETNGTIVLTMRDIGKLLLEQIVFPPVIPYGEYPLQWSKIRTEEVEGRAPFGGTWSRAILDEGEPRSSNELYFSAGHTETDPGTGSPYVEEDGVVLGHNPIDPVRNEEYETVEEAPFWLSTGQENRWDRVWWEYDFHESRSVAALRLNVVGGPYRIYISLLGSDGQWRGRREISYEMSTKNVNIHADKPFVKTDIAIRGRTFDVVLKKVYHDISRVRITFTRLWDSKDSEDYPWRAGLRSVQIYRNTTGDPDGSEMEIGPGTRLDTLGNYVDYTDIVKWICCWGGFHWPGHGQPTHSGEVAEDYVRLGWVGPAGDMVNLKRYVTWENYDQRLPRGRAWGDFMETGTNGVAELTVDLFDKQPLMDVISYVRDVVGFLFFVDELGGAIWRMPNIIKQGNYLSPTELGANVRSRTSQYVTIDEEETLLDYTMSVSSESNREVIFVANLTGNYGVAIEGYAPADARMRRTAGWTDGKFESKQETRIMADLIATQQMFNYRRGKVVTPGYPAIQIDDQVKIFARVTADAYFHYVLGIESNLDMQTGEWTYTLDTHWLGEDQETWALDTTVLHNLTQTYLNQLGVEDEDNGVTAIIEDETEESG